MSTMLSFKKGENLGINERGKFYFSFFILIFDNVDKILFYSRDKGCLFAEILWSISGHSDIFAINFIK